MLTKNSRKSDWDIIINSNSSWFDLRLNELTNYRDLIFLFVKRDFISIYKQTILGPLWFFIQPILTTIIFTIVFGKIAKLPTDGLPPVMFYMAGVVGWNYFSDCITNTSSVFTINSHIFGKVYFPRIIVPLSIIISSLLKFGVQLLLFFFVLAYYFCYGVDIQPNLLILSLPLLIFLMAGIGLGLGLIISSLTAKYRDLKFLIGFGVQLLMYITPVVYPLSFLTEKYKWLILLNPMTGIIETFRFAFLGEGVFNIFYLAYSFVFMVFVLIIGFVVFQKVEKNFMDSV